MKRAEVQRVRRLLVGALLLYEAYLVEEVGTQDEVASAPLVIATLLEEISDRLGSFAKPR